MAKEQTVVMDVTNVTTLTGKEMEEVNEAFEGYQDALIKDIDALATSLGVSRECAQDVTYLRTRHRHTEALEEELIALHRVGIRPCMSEFGCSTESGKALLEEALKHMN